MERSHSIFCRNRHKIDITTLLLLSGGTKYIHTKKTMEIRMLHRHLIFSFVYWYNRQILFVQMTSSRIRLGQSFKTVGYGCASCWGDVGAGNVEADIFYIPFIVSVQYIGY